MGLGARLSRYRDFATFLARHGRSEPHASVVEAQRVARLGSEFAGSLGKTDRIHT
jgi:hypothetical protein